MKKLISATALTFLTLIASAGWSQEQNIQQRVTALNVQMDEIPADSYNSLSKEFKAKLVKIFTEAQQLAFTDIPASSLSQEDKSELETALASNLGAVILQLHAGFDAVEPMPNTSNSEFGDTVSKKVGWLFENWGRDFTHIFPSLPFIGKDAQRSSLSRKLVSQLNKLNAAAFDGSKSPEAASRLKFLQHFVTTTQPLTNKDIIKTQLHHLMGTAVPTYLLNRIASNWLIEPTTDSRFWFRMAWLTVGATFLYVKTESSGLLAVNALNKLKKLSEQFGKLPESVRSAACDSELGSYSTAKPQHGTFLPPEVTEGSSGRSTSAPSTHSPRSRRSSGY